MNQSEQMNKALGVSEATGDPGVKAFRAAVVKYFNARPKEHQGNIANDLAVAIQDGIQDSKLDGKTKGVLLSSIKNRFGG